MPVVMPRDEPVPGGVRVKLRGLPWSASREDVAGFLAGLNVAESGRLRLSEAAS